MSTLLSCRKNGMIWYCMIWYNCADTFQWSNIVSLVELVFAIPLSNGYVERCFSQLKFTKCDRISCLKQDRLDILLCIMIEGPFLDKWNSIHLWWGDKTRRVNRSETSRPSIYMYFKSSCCHWRRVFMVP